MWTIRPEDDADADAVAKLVAASFGPGRYAKSAYRLREGVRPVDALSFVAVEDGVLKGSVRFWPISVGGNAALLLGPLAVDGAQRGRGIGLALMKRGIEEARARGHRAVLLVGDAPYYGRAGFQPFEEHQVRFPGPVDRARILGLSLVDDGLQSLAGEVRRARIDDPVCADGAPLGQAELFVTAG